MHPCRRAQLCQTLRLPRRDPLSLLKGATPTRAAIRLRLRVPNSGRYASGLFQQSDAVTPDSRIGTESLHEAYEPPEARLMASLGDAHLTGVDHYHRQPPLPEPTPAALRDHRNRSGFDADRTQAAPLVVISTPRVPARAYGRHPELNVFSPGNRSGV